MKLPSDATLRTAAWAVGAFALGFAAATWGPVSVEPKVNVTDVLEVAAAVVIAILVAIIGQKRHGEDRAEKDLLIGSTREAIASLQEVRQVLERAYKTGQNDLRATTASLETLGLTLSDLAGLLSDADHDDAFGVVRDLNRNEFRSLYRKMSGGAFPSQAYPAEVYVDAKQLVRGMNDALRKLVFTINRK